MESSPRFECLLNLQQSLDEEIILGESALRNSYLVFDALNRRIGFAPAQTKYN